MRRALIALPIVIAACATEQERAVETDPSGSACRGQAATATGVEFGETAAALTNINLLGIRTYLATAGEVRYRCTVDLDGVIVDFARL